MPSSGNILQWLVICLLGLAVVMVNSAGMTVGDDAVSMQSLLMGRTAVYAVLAIGAMVVVGHLDIRRLYAQRGFFNPVAWLLVISLVLCVLALVPGLGRNVNGASRWLNLGPASWRLSFQPSELAKWTTMIAMAWWGARHAGGFRRFGDGLLGGIVILAIVCGLIVVEDLGTAVLIGMVGILLLMAAGARWWHVALLTPPAISAVIALILTSPYRVKRLLAFTDPWADPQGIGYHLIQSQVAIAGGGLFGRGVGNGLQKFGYLPEDTTDFLFAIICEEMGLAGACLVIGLYLSLLWVGLGVVKDCRHPFGRLLGLGVLLTIGIQAAMNIAVVTGSVPTKGIALPLMSYGGTGWVMCSAAVGLLVAIDRLNQLEAAAEGEADPELASDPAPVVSVSAADYPVTA
ncbi:MAG: stage V sporulation protein E [Planctomycetes bacterium]|nr:stage V sporulation protein E [Planctomycetota bacterium]